MNLHSKDEQFLKCAEHLGVCAVVLWSFSLSSGLEGLGNFDRNQSGLVLIKVQYDIMKESCSLDDHTCRAASDPPGQRCHLCAEESQQHFLIPLHHMSRRLSRRWFGSVHLLCSQAWRTQIKPPVLNFFNSSALDELPLVHTRPANSGGRQGLFRSPVAARLGLTWPSNLTAGEALNKRSRDRSVGVTRRCTLGRKTLSLCRA